MSALLPHGWLPTAHELWQQGQRGQAVERLLSHVNAPAALLSPCIGHLEQLSFYAFLSNDLRGALVLLEKVCGLDSSRLESVRNLGVLYGRLGQHAKAVETCEKVVKQTPNDAIAWDVLAAKYHQVGKKQESQHAGTQSLMIKDQHAVAQFNMPSDWQLPAQRASAGKSSIEARPNVIAFSLWGAQPRYLRGALRNVLVAPGLFPGWTLRFYVDKTVPSEFIQLLRDLAVQVEVDEGKPKSLRERLCWRFQVANDPHVGYFLVRDADSVLSYRESLAVQGWLLGSAHFHVIRDWWTHTDLILAGMWGGVAGLLPAMDDMLRNYQSAQMETPNIDQWFLRDRVWPLIRHSVCMHDRLFSMPGAQVLPGDLPPQSSSMHVGQNEHAVRAAEQAQLLQHWIAKYPWL